MKKNTKKTESRRPNNVRIPFPFKSSPWMKVRPLTGGEFRVFLTTQGWYLHRLRNLNTIVRYLRLIGGGDQACLDIVLNELKIIFEHGAGAGYEHIEETCKRHGLGARFVRRLETEFTVMDESAMVDGGEIVIG